MIRLLTFTTLYPNAARPSHGIFVENRLEHLLRSGAVTARVVAPIASFSLLDRLYAPFRATRAIPALESRRGIDVLHPRYPLLPKVSMTVAPLSLFAATRPLLERIRAEGYDFDLIDSHYFYPDGVAAVMLGRALGRPVVITGRGSDLNLLPEYALPGRMIRWAAENAAGLITVSAALKRRLVEQGIAAPRIHVLRNGVDLERFRPVDRAAARQRLQLSGLTLLSAGNLIPLKGHDLVIRALTDLPESELLIAGSGPQEPLLRRLAETEGVIDRVRFLGRLPHESLPEIYGAADALVLASNREGWPNVLLEAMACGTPVIATRVGGVPEIIQAEEAGEFVEERTPSAIAQAVRRLLARRPDRRLTRQYAERFSWAATTAGQIDVFQEALRLSVAKTASPESESACASS